MLGAGSQCVVARVRFQGQDAVCKRLRPRMRREALAHRALAREEAVLRTVRAATVPRLLAAGEDGHGPFLVESAHDGLPLRALVAGLVARHGRVPAGTVASLARAAFAALVELHEVEDAQGPLRVAHGDLGPDHLIVGPARAGERGRIGLVDFGQARARGLDGEPGARGTLPYVSPEVARAERGVDQEADVFAMAATVVFAALGRDPCREANASARLVEIAERGLELEALDAVPGLGAPLTDALRGALAFERDRRVVTARAVLARMERR